MSLLFVALLLSGASAEGEAGTRQPAISRPYHEISRDLRELMKRESLAQSEAERVAAIYQLAELYLEIKRDPRLATAPTLQQYKAKLWSRLTRVKSDLLRQLAREKAEANRGRRPEEIAADEQVLNAVRQASETLTAQLALVSYSMGGPARLLAQSGGGAFGGGAIRDYGDDLVRLITHVIEPDFWDVNGGPGSIFYYRPLHALVVRATTEVHHKIGGVVGGLRAAGP